MEEQNIIEELTEEKVGELTETQVAKIINCIEREPDKEKRLRYLKMIDAVFEVRSISAKNRNLKADLAFFDFKFFPIEKSSYIRGIRKKGKRI